MTSMPASRSARETTLAPRSWPSRPGLAIRTLIFLTGMASSFARPRSKRHRLLVFPVDVFQSVHDLSQGCVSLDAFQEIGHEILFVAGRLFEGGERLFNPPLVPG